MPSMPSKEIPLAFSRLVIAAIIIMSLLLGLVALLIWHTGRSPRRRPLRSLRPKDSQDPQGPRHPPDAPTSCTGSTDQHR